MRFDSHKRQEDDQIIVLSKAIVLEGFLWCFLKHYHLILLNGKSSSFVSVSPKKITHDQNIFRVINDNRNVILD